MYGKQTLRRRKNQEPKAVCGLSQEIQVTDTVEIHTHESSGL